MIPIHPLRPYHFLMPSTLTIAEAEQTAADLQHALDSGPERVIPWIVTREFPDNLVLLCTTTLN